MAETQNLHIARSGCTVLSIQVSLAQLLPFPAPSREDPACQPLLLHACCSKPQRTDSASHMNYDNPPPYPGPGPTAPYPPYAQQPGAPPGPYPGYPPGPAGPCQPGQPGYQGYPQYGWQNAPPPPGPVYADGPKNTVYVVEERRRDDTGESACLTACWTALCCCCLWDMLT
ncbi:cysteine-rich and transmembrane domain-containing protein 1 isoform X1 [Cuculus canorus]|uniref:cysteine-rich and transmembrane domain-containing protein 1 isoform X1 n=2 Tax=Cuculus canorus TaxID=55661 RepID=UPI0023AA7CA5|nr:cysteine-rich and transmembrane domain-containing protein 1 isoform X1 [Cuculus canorus]